MKRNAFAATLAVLLLSLPAQAQTDFATLQIDRLENEGFSVAEVKRTLLGRILIVSKNRTNLREVVLDRHTGAVLRDRLFALPADGIPATTTPQPQTGTAPATGDNGTGAPGVSNGGAESGSGGENGGNGDGGNGKS